MKAVLRIIKEENTEKPIEFLEGWSEDLKEWEVVTSTPSQWDNVLYRETIDGLDYFICWDNGGDYVKEYRGHLNSGKY
jgi:hypothetical protein